MKLKKRIKKLEKQIKDMSDTIYILDHDYDVLFGKVISLESNKNKEIIDKCAKIAEDFFEDDVIQGIQIAKELREILDATPVSKKGN